MRYLVFATALVAATAIAGSAAADPVTSFGPGSVTGSGRASVATPGGVYSFQLEVSARGDADGATGHLSLTDASGRYRADADCVLVAGNAAGVVGTITEGPDAGELLVAEVVDNGHGAHGAPDAAVAGPQAVVPGFDPCHPSLMDFSDAFPLDHGNFTVRDGS
jgi:hypothetical protein